MRSLADYLGAHGSLEWEHILPERVTPHNRCPRVWCWQWRVYLSIKWAVDGMLAYMHAQGIGSELEESLMYLETDSPTWGFLNSQFIIGDMTFTDPTTGVLGLYTLVKT
ncbi:hypothetical protein OBBRIDRAFT_456157 [Obba rivulosa]|uniref:Uncharacterized protein n=1 Tax=Obba rivulosa TaxID=1052685 RepID=A0A8E2DN89_9APHY|nr:hypothetical protein OBBRIDRAFT_456157 [Obba rivulosa]